MRGHEARRAVGEQPEAEAVERDLRAAALADGRATRHLDRLCRLLRLRLGEQQPVVTVAALTKAARPSELELSPLQLAVSEYTRSSPSCSPTTPRSSRSSGSSEASRPCSASRAWGR